MLCWTLWTPFFAASAIAKHLVAPNIIQPNIFACFTTICGVQIHVYKYVSKRNNWKSFPYVNFGSILGTSSTLYGIIETLCCLLLLGGLEVALYFAATVLQMFSSPKMIDLYLIKAAGWVPQVLGAIAIAFIVGGFLPQYWTVISMYHCEF
jgi:hypothetical protein